MSDVIGTKVTELDLEWIELIQEARELGLTFAEIRDFLQKGKV